jgi:hypothetical protein
MWHDSEIRELTELWQSGLSHDAIAAQLHRGRTTVLVKLRELGLHREREQSGRPAKTSPREGAAAPPRHRYGLNRVAIVHRKFDRLAQPIPFTKQELHNMLVEAVRNTLQLPD